MPSILTAYDKVSYICAHPFLYNGKQFNKGDDVPDAIKWGNLESLVRSRRLIPVVDNYSLDAPLQFKRTVLTRALALRKLGLAEEVPATEQENEPVEDGEYNPAEHKIEDVLDYVDEYPEELLSVYALEEQGKNRPRLKKQLDDRLNAQAEKENEDG